MDRMTSFAFGGWVSAAVDLPNATNDYALRVGLHGLRSAVTSAVTNGIYVTLSYAGLIATCKAASSATDLTLASIGSLAHTTGYKVSCVYNGTATYWWFNDSYIGSITTNIPAGTVWFDFGWGGERIAGVATRFAAVSGIQLWALLT
jgi:hypothetical protein